MDKILEAKKALAEYYPKLRRDIIALREQGIEHQKIQVALKLTRALYWYHLHQAEKITGKSLS